MPYSREPGRYPAQLGEILRAWFQKGMPTLRYPFPAYRDAITFRRMLYSFTAACKTERRNPPWDELYQIGSNLSVALRVAGTDIPAQPAHTGPVEVMLYTQTHSPAGLALEGLLSSLTGSPTEPDFAGMESRISSLGRDK